VPTRTRIDPDMVYVCKESFGGSGFGVAFASSRDADPRRPWGVPGLRAEGHARSGYVAAS